jgi:hypothetical protein
MARVLLIGIDPDEVDFTDPALPPGLDPEIIRRGVAIAQGALKAAGREAAQAYLPANPEAAVLRLEAELGRASFDCVVIGGGVVMPPRNRRLFEALLNAIGRHHPTPAIALISRPEEAADAVARVLPA